MDEHITPVPQEKAYRLLNHGPTVLVSARHGGVDDVMAAAWSCALDFSPPKLTVVLDKATKTRELVERSGVFAIQVPTAAQLELVYQVGHRSLHEQPEKLARSGVGLFDLDGRDLPFVSGCSAWLACRVIPEPHIQRSLGGRARVQQRALDFRDGAARIAQPALHRRRALLCHRRRKGGPHAVPGLKVPPQLAARSEMPYSFGLAF